MHSGLPYMILVSGALGHRAVNVFLSACSGINVTSNRTRRKHFGFYLLILLSENLKRILQSFEKEVVLAHTAVTKYRERGVTNSRNEFPSVLEVRTPRPERQRSQSLLSYLFLSGRWFSCCREWPLWGFF